MGIYINKGNEAFRQVRNSEYVDKSGLIAVVNKTLFTEQKLSCVTRSRRFYSLLGAGATVLLAILTWVRTRWDIAAMDEPVTVIANCSTIEALRLELVKDYQPVDYWAQ